MDRIDFLRGEIAKREAELADLKVQLTAAENERRDEAEGEWTWPLLREDYERYSRQMIVPNSGLQGQLRLKKAKVLLVGAGGLGCPAAAYLAGAGVSVLGLVDGDQVEVSNLHRQIAHSTGRVGMSKVRSAIAYLQSLNPSIEYKAHETHLTTENAEEIVSQHDLVLDCTDHPTSRYLISDICVLLSKPLVTASAFQTSGQLIVLNDPPGSGPCYRCVFPKPPPPESVVGCGEGGILGPVVGVMGVLQAMEALKLIVRGGLETREVGEDVKETRMLLYSGMADTPFRTVRMKGKRGNCFACGGQGALTLDEFRTSLDYVQFCGVTAPVKLLDASDRVTPTEYSQHSAYQNGVLLDVREREHFDLCHLPGSVNLPISHFTSHRADAAQAWMPQDISPAAPIHVICRVGNDSQLAVQKLKELGLDSDGRFIGDIKGGMKAWKDTVDPTLPFV